MKLRQLQRSAMGLPHFNFSTKQFQTVDWSCYFIAQWQIFEMTHSSRLFVNRDEWSNKKAARRGTAGH